MNFLANIFFKHNSAKKQNTKLSRKDALEILGLQEGATKEQIMDSYQKLMKKNHPDLGGSDWITKKLNEARDILLG
ncbi:MAG: molecular chaperone DnaJ [Rickettsiales bacterium]|nr:molecular chaperone DnaJ [Rickettsiales bacterium]